VIKPPKIVVPELVFDSYWFNVCFSQNTLAVRGLEEPRNSQELLIESVGPFFCFVFYVKFNTTSYVRTYGGTTCIYGLTDGWTDGQTDGQINLGGLGNLRFLQVKIIEIVLIYA
jgi:hypothetical protein